jgi:hypothetical protein
LIAILLAAAASAQTPTAPPKGFLPLSAAPGNDMTTRLCSPDRRWCVIPPEPEDTNVYVDEGPTGESYWSPPEGDGSAYTLFPAVAPLKAGGALLLMQAKRSRGYSGGGASFTDWVVLHVAKEGTVRRVLTTPASSSLMIRACFSDKDEVKRAGACHDQYELAGMITLTEDGSAMPPINFEAKASFFPRGIRPNVDSLTLPPRKEKDLVWQQDATCSYRRTFTFQVAQQQYFPDAPPPNCDQYLDD